MDGADDGGDDDEELPYVSPLLNPRAGAVGAKRKRDPADDGEEDEGGAGGVEDWEEEIRAIVAERGAIPVSEVNADSLQFRYYIEKDKDRMKRALRAVCTMEVRDGVKVMVLKSNV